MKIQKNTLMIGALVVAIAGVLFFAVPATVGAVTGTPDDSTQTTNDDTSTSDTTNTATDDKTSTADSRRETEVKKADENKVTERQKLCDNRSTVLKNTMLRMSDRGTKLIDLFSTISTRVQNFYIEKGYNVPNYNALVADISVKKEAAKAAVNVLTTEADGFSCDSGDPKASIVEFRAALSAERSALKDYRTSVKNLIVAVKAVYTASSQGAQQ